MYCHKGWRRGFDWRRARLTAALVAGLAAPYSLVQGELPEWISTLPSGDAMEQVFYRTVELLGKPVSWRKTPGETRPLLTEAIGRTPAQARLYYLRAREAEAQLDFAAAERDWEEYVRLSPDKAGAWLEKADYHQRRLQPKAEVAALLEAGAAGGGAGNFTRALQVCAEHLLPETNGVLVAWQRRFPQSQEAYQQQRAHLKRTRDWAGYPALVERYRAAFPNDTTTAFLLRAEMAAGQGSPAAAIAMLEKEMQPDWPKELFGQYLWWLERQGSLRQRLAAAQQSAGGRESGAAQLRAVALLFHYYAGRNDREAALRVLDGYREKSANLPAQGLELLAEWYTWNGELATGARMWHALYMAGPENGPNAEKGLAGLAGLLLQHANEPIAFGQQDLQLLREIGKADESPGFLNGILALVLNNEVPEAGVQTAETQARGLFHRRKAEELIGVLGQRFPQAAALPRLRNQLIGAYFEHRELEAAITNSVQFLTAFPKAPEKVGVGLRLANAYAGRGRLNEEFALYQQMLQELAPPAGAPAREYTQVLDQALARYVALRRLPEALGLLRREVERRPNDPAMFEKLAAFLEQNKLAGELEAVYRRAMQQFPNSTWSHRLARFYLGQKRSADYAALSRQVTAVFSGLELERYLQATAGAAAYDPALYRQVSLFAYQRFPHHIPFVRNLLRAYQARGTANPVEYEALLRRHFADDAGLRDEFFSYLNRTGKLGAELVALQGQLPAGGAAVQARQQPAAAYFVAQGEAWRSHFETAAPLLENLARGYPHDRALLRLTSDLHRSLAAYDERQLRVAQEMEGALAKGYPQDTGALTKLGEMEAERERFAQATAYFDQVVAVAPGSAERYLEAATLHWDYFRYDDALRQIRAARQRLQQPSLFAFEAGAIFENKGDMAGAIGEYAQGALASARPAEADGAWPMAGGGASSGGGDGEVREGQAGEGQVGDGMALQRLITLGRRPAHAAAVRAAIGAWPLEAAALGLRLRMLEELGDSEGVKSLVMSMAGRLEDSAALAILARAATRYNYAEGARAVLTRRIALALDPATQLRLRLERVQMEEEFGNQPAAASEVEALLREQPMRLGVVRAAVNYYWRNKNAARSLAILQQAAGRAKGQLAFQLQLEAANKANQSANYNLAASIAKALLAKEPLQEQAAAVLVDGMARQGDDAGIAAHYRARLELLRTANLPAGERQARVDGMRRNLIPALARRNDAAGAVDQYIELLKRYPEDLALLEEAARYAQSTQQQERLTAYFRKAETDSPRDARWPIVRARLEAAFANQGEALAAWERAVRLRPERADLLTAKADLEMRLLRLDAAYGSLERLYTLSYQNPAWLVRMAEVRARQKNGPETVTLLRRALVENRTSQASGMAAMAEQLLTWGMTSEAQTAATQSLTALAASPAAEMQRYRWQTVQVFAKVQARLRQYGDLAVRLTPVQSSRLEERQGLWSQVAGVVLQEASERYTPEEKAAVVAWVEGLPEMQASELARVAESNGFAALAARQYAKTWTGSNGQGQYELVRLQQRRGKFGELAVTMEARGRAVAGDAEETQSQKLDLRRQAAQLYELAGDTTGAVRALGSLRGNQTDEEQARWLDALSAGGSKVLPATVKVEGRAWEALANQAMAQGRGEVAARAIERASHQTALWRNRYRALTGLYFRQSGPEVARAFAASLGPETIGEKLAKAGDRETYLVGEDWFHQAASYGMYQAAVATGGGQGVPGGQGAAGGQGVPGGREAEAHWLLARLEGRGGTGAYIAHAQLAQEAGQLGAARASWQLALSLLPDGPSGMRLMLHRGLAETAAAQKDAAETLAQLQQVLRQFTTMPGEQLASANVEQAMQAALRVARSNGHFEALRGELVRGLQRMARSSGSYQLLPYVELLTAAEVDSIVAQMATPELGLAQFLEAGNWRPAEKEALLRGALLRTERAAATGEPARREALAEVRRQYFGFLVQNGMDQQALALAQQVEAQRVEAQGGGQQEYEGGLDGSLRLLAQARTATSPQALGLWLEGKGYDAETLRKVAARLQGESGAGTSAGGAGANAGAGGPGRQAVAQVLLEKSYEADLRQNPNSVSALLGLAALRFDQSRASEAQALLTRLTFTAGEPFSQHEGIANLLLQKGRAGEAVALLGPVVAVSPWDSRLRWTYAQAVHAASGRQDLQPLESMAGNGQEPYALRLAAANLLRRSGKAPSANFAATVGSKELAVVAAQGLPATAAEADGAYFTEGRRRMAEGTREATVRVRLLRNGLAEAPNEGWFRSQLFTALSSSGRRREANAILRGEMEGGLPETASEAEALAYVQNLLALQEAEAATVTIEQMVTRRQMEPLAGAAPATWEQAKSRAKALAAMQSGNQQRRPFLNDGLSQEVLVRPRLVTPPTVTSPTVTASAGGAR